jgi:hypothetical protein
MEQEFCPVCEQPMHWFGDHWLCIQINVHDSAAYQRRRSPREVESD